MTDRINQDEINSILWKACDTFRGTIDPSEYKNYILVMLFLKYISDVWKDRYAALMEQHDNDETRAKRQLRYERFILPEGADYDTLYEQRNEANLGELINIALEKIEDANKEKLENVFRNIDFNSEANLGRTKQRNERLKNLLEDFHDPRLDMRPSHIGNPEIIGNAYEYLIGKFANSTGKRSGEFYTPPEVNLLLAQLLNPQSGEHICDPACGSGSLLIKCAMQVPDSNYWVRGQEINGTTWALCMMNMYLRNIDVTTQHIKWGDTLKNPQLIVDNQTLERFNVVVANPPFSLDRWGAENADTDRFGRFHRGVPPASKGDYAFITHLIETTYLDPTQNGRVGVIVPHGVLFRGGAEGRIRQQLIEENLLDAVIGLPANIFFGTGIPAAILIFKRNKIDDKVLFIDASREFEPGRIQNTLREIDINKILQTYHNRVDVDGYAHLAEKSEIQSNDYNLNIARYTFAYENPDEQIVVSTGPGQHDVFISYSHKDKNRKKEIVDELLQAGMRIWDDDAYTLNVGTPDWQIQIEKSIEAANCVVVLLSPDAKESIWVRRELMYAQTHHKPIFPVLVEGNEQTSVPLLLINAQHANLQAEYRKQLDDLIDTLKERVGIRKVRSPYIYDLTKQRPGWKQERLDTLVDLLRPRKKIDKNNLKEKGDYPFYSPSGITGYSDTYEFEGEYLLVPGMISSGHERFTRNAWKSENNRFSASPEVWVLKPCDLISIDFLLFTLWVTDFRPFTDPSVGRKRVSLKDISIAVPPLDEQNLISEYIVEQMSVIEERQRQLELRLGILASNKIGIIHRMFYMQDLVSTDDE